MEKLLTVEEAAEALRVHYQTVYKWLRSGELKGSRIGKKWMVTETEIDRFIQDHAAAR